MLSTAQVARHSRGAVLAFLYGTGVVDLSKEYKSADLKKTKFDFADVPMVTTARPPKSLLNANGSPCFPLLIHDSRMQATH